MSRQERQGNTRQDNKTIK